MSINTLQFDIHKNSIQGINTFYHQKETILYSPHGHNFYEVFYVTEGQAIHLCNNIKTIIKKGSLIFIRPGDVHQYLETTVDFSFYNLAFATEKAEAIFSLLDTNFISQNFIKPDNPPEVTLKGSEIDSLTMRFEKEIEITDINNRLCYTINLLISLFPLFSFNNFLVKRIIPNWFQLLLEDIDREKNYTKGLKTFYSLATRSREHVSRCFKQYLDTTPTDYINNKKLIYTSNLLSQSNIDIIEIGEMAGFNSHSHFYHLFKTKFGISPKRYRVLNTVKHKSDY